MAHGAPDYSNVRKQEFTYRVDDMAELAARQSNAVSLERKGEVIFFEDFSKGLDRWTTNPYGTGSSVKLSAANSVSKGFSAELIGGSDGAQVANMGREHPYLSVSKMGIECRVNLFSNVLQFYLYIDHYNGTTLQAYKCRIDIPTNKAAIQVPGGSMTNIFEDMNFTTTGLIFAFIKVTFNASTEKYTTLQVNHRKADISSYGPYEIIDTTSPKVVAVCQVRSDTGENGKVLVDNVIITRNE